MAISNNSTGLRSGVCTSTTRPVSPYEGQMIYETDTDMVAIWNGSAWRYIAATTPTNGTVLQVLSGTTTGLVPVTSSTFIDTGLTITITPKSTSSKIFVTVNQSVYADTANNESDHRLLRGSTVLQRQLAPTFNSVGATVGSATYMFLDSPATTSATIYKTQIARFSGAGTVYANINSNPSNITVMEIAG